MKTRDAALHAECAGLRDTIVSQLGSDGVVVLPPMDIELSSRLLLTLGFHAQCCVLDPWYNKGVGGVRDDYDEYVPCLLRCVAPLSDHVFLWGFPEIVARFVRTLPEPLALRCWLTWFYRNSPSRIRGWRSAQMACLHLTTPAATMHVENFLNEAQKEKARQGKLLFIPGPPSVIEESLLCGFVGRNEQTGHPSQKPVSVIERTLLMATARGELVIDLMSGSGTTGEAAVANERFAVLCDISEEYTCIAEKRLEVERIKIAEPLLSALSTQKSDIRAEGATLPARHPRPMASKHSSHHSQLALALK